MNRIPTSIICSLLVPLIASACARDGGAPNSSAIPLERTKEHEARTTQETVILIHGLGRSRASMWALGLRLRAAGYHTLNFPYAPPLESVDEIAASLAVFIRREVQTPRYHLVAHSLGNVIVRKASAAGLPEGLSRIVMLAPPNHPPELASRLRGAWLFQWITGDSGRRLAEPAFYESLPIPEAPFGVIAGTRGQRLTFDEPNDGVVTVASTRLAGMRDFITLRRTHTFLMNGAETARQCVSFLRWGVFDRTPAPRPWRFPLGWGRPSPKALSGAGPVRIRRVLTARGD